MNYANAAKKYQSSSVETASPGRLILMLYDGAIRFSSAARAALDKTKGKNIEEASKSISRAQAIISELQSSLKFDVGGDFSITMFKLYDFIFEKLREAQSKQSADPIDPVLKILHDLRSAWAEMLNGAEEAVINKVTSISTEV